MYVPGGGMRDDGWTRMRMMVEGECKGEGGRAKRGLMGVLFFSSYIQYDASPSLGNGQGESSRILTSDRAPPPPPMFKSTTTLFLLFGKLLASLDVAVKKKALFNQINRFPISSFIITVAPASSRARDRTQTRSVLVVIHRSTIKASYPPS